MSNFTHSKHVTQKSFILRRYGSNLDYKDNKPSL